LDAPWFSYILLNDNNVHNSQVCMEGDSSGA